MSDYIIATSSTSDLPRTWLEEHNIPFIAYSYTVNDEPREDDCREETRAAVYAGMRRGDKLQIIQKQHRAFVLRTESRHFFIQKSRG